MGPPSRVLVPLEESWMMFPASTWQFKTVCSPIQVITEPLHITYEHLMGVVDFHTCRQNPNISTLRTQKSDV